MPERANRRCAKRIREARVAMEMETLERLHAREEGLVVEDDESPDGEWQVSWKVEEHLMD
jgi:hypothetical protein